MFPRRMPALANGGDMFLSNPSKETAVFCLALLSWMAVAPFFLLMCVFRALCRKCRKHKRPLAVNAAWSSMICFVISAASIWMMLRHAGAAWKLGWVGEYDKVFVGILVPNVLVLVVSGIACVRSCRDVCRPPAPHSPDNGKAERKGE